MRERAERKRVISSSAIRTLASERACRHMCRARRLRAKRPDEFGCSGFSLVGCVKQETIIRESGLLLLLLLVSKFFVQGRGAKLGRTLKEGPN